MTLEHFESDTLNLMDLAKIVCMDATGNKITTDDVSEVLQLLGDRRSSRKRPGLDSDPWRQAAELPVPKPVRSIGTGVRRAKRTAKSAATQ